MFGTLWKSVAYRKPFDDERSERPVQTARWEGGPDGLELVPSLHPTPPLFVYWKFGPCVSYVIKTTLGSIFLGKELRQEYDVEAERDGTVLSVLLVLVLDSSPQASVAYV